MLTNPPRRGGPPRPPALDYQSVRGHRLPLLSINFLTTIRRGRPLCLPFWRFAIRQAWAGVEACPYRTVFDVCIAIGHWPNWPRVTNLRVGEGCHALPHWETARLAILMAFVIIAGHKISKSLRRGGLPRPPAVANFVTYRQIYRRPFVGAFSMFVLPSDIGRIGRC
jgi:hypothetical protein